MLTIKSLPEAENFVAEQKKLGADCYWDNYDIVVFRTSPAGMYSTSGAFRNGQWGFANRAAVKSDGTWEVDARNVQYSNSSGN